MSDSVRPHRRQPTRLPVPGILQARTLEWVAISSSSAWKWKVKVKSLSRVRLLETPWTAAYQAPPSMGFSRQEYWSGVSLPSLPFPVFKWLLLLTQSQLSALDKTQTLKYEKICRNHAVTFQEPWGYSKGGQCREPCSSLTCYSKLRGAVVLPNILWRSSLICIRDRMSLVQPDVEEREMIVKSILFPH